jgi:hypothetical protein
MYKKTATITGFFRFTKIFLSGKQPPVTPKGMNQPLISSYSGLNSSE